MMITEYIDNRIPKGYEYYEDMRIECYECHTVINFHADDVIENRYVKCPRCGEEISILP